MLVNRNVASDSASAGLYAGRHDSFDGVKRSRRNLRGQRMRILLLLLNVGLAGCSKSHPTEAQYSWARLVVPVMVDGTNGVMVWQFRYADDGRLMIRTSSQPHFEKP
jgi:hypothetical protein